MSLAYGAQLDLESITVEGIAGLIPWTCSSPGNSATA